MSFPPGDVYAEHWRGPEGGEVVCVPILHGRVEFAEAVGRAFAALNPTRVALELPPTLKSAWLAAARRLPAITVLTYETAGGSVWLPVESVEPLAEATRRALDAGIPVEFVDGDIDEVPERYDPAPDSYALNRIGHKVYVEEWLCGAKAEADAGDLVRERAMAAGLAALVAPGERILFVCGLAHMRRVAAQFSGPHALPLVRVRGRRPQAYHLAVESLGEASSEIPFVAAVYELTRLARPPMPEGGATVRKRVGAFELIGGRPGWNEEAALLEALGRAAHLNGAPCVPFDRQRALYHLVTLAGVHYRQETGEEVAPWARRALFKFLRNWALVEGRLLPDLYQLIEAAKGVVDDNFAYALWRLATFSPWQGGEQTMPVATVTADMLGLGSRSVRMRRRLPRPKARPLRVGGRRGKGVDPAHWLEGFNGGGICSYPPEDVVVENFGRWLKGKAKSVWSEEHSKSLPFSGSMEDGIDMRETARRLAEGKIYVRRKVKISGGLGSVVVIFDEEDADSEKYPFRMTWLGEHEQESDMAFYATDPFANVAGPGICRVEYGGFILSYPPLRLGDVWTDPDYYWAATPAERLLAAAIEYSLEENVVYCAPKPPRSYLRQFATRLGRRIVYVPKGSLGPLALKKIRVMHVLDGKEVRTAAADYIW